MHGSLRESLVQLRHPSLAFYYFYFYSIVCFVLWHSLLCAVLYSLRIIIIWKTEGLSVRRLSLRMSIELWSSIPGLLFPICCQTFEVQIEKGCWLILFLFFMWLQWLWRSSQCIGHGFQFASLITKFVLIILYLHWFSFSLRWGWWDFDVGGSLDCRIWRWTGRVVVDLLDQHALS